MRKIISVPSGIYGATVSGVMVGQDDEVIVTLTTTTGIKIKCVLKEMYDKVRKENELFNFLELKKEDKCPDKE